MSVYRRWFCTCTGNPLELIFDTPFEDEAGEPVCARCGATPSSDPRKTVTYRDQDSSDE